MPALAIDRIFRMQCWIIAAVVAAHLASRLMFAFQERESSLSKVLNMLEETSVPTVVATGSLLAAAAAAGLVALSARQQRDGLWRSWAFVTACLVFLAVDEGAALHDRLTFPLQDMMDLGGIFYIGWVLPYLLLCVVCGVLCLKLAFALPRRTLLRFIVAGSVFVGAALGLEMIESAVIHHEAGPDTALRDADLETIARTPLMTLLVTLEETGELLGAALLLRALLLHLVQDRQVSSIRLSLGQAAPEADAYVAGRNTGSRML
ncbi:hypothetical protein ACFOD4_07630 [Pseudoroseomonas globiformis]|uniref:Uncharacterized protein n=1 Tax=Teichococcus globiformis TaxID=2307229 RepID=A0ABV7G0I1_9PROT